jgi:hypothetical protein
VVLIEPGSVLQAILIDVQDRDFIRDVKSQRSPRYREVLVAHLEEPAKREDGVCDAAVSGVDDQVLDCSQILLFAVQNLGSEIDLFTMVV